MGRFFGNILPVRNAKLLLPNTFELANDHFWQNQQLSESANVWISKCPLRVSKWQGWLKSANVWVSKCPGPVSKCLISKCLSANVRSANGKSAKFLTPNLPASGSTTDYMSLYLCTSSGSNVRGEDEGPQRMC